MDVSELKCDQCGLKLPAGRQQFCSTRCQAKYYYHAVVKPALQAAKAARPPRICERCGTSFSAQSHGRRRYCSDRCEQATYNATRRSKEVKDADIERYWTKVDRRSEDECWPWQGRLDGDGYGVCSAGAREVRAHRLGWKLAHPGEELTASDVIRHSCDRMACQNPAHLLKGTHAENVADMLERERNSRGEGRPASKLTKQIVADIASEYATGQVSQQELADRYGVSRSVIGNVVRGEGWTAIPRVDTSAARAARKTEQPYHVRGDNHPLAQLSEEKVREIRRRYAAGGVTQQQLAEEYGVDRTNISQIVRRKSWTHVSD